MKRGDKVKILCKTKGVSLDFCGIPAESSGTIVHMYYESLDIMPYIHNNKFQNYTFHISDVELIKEELMYEVVRDKKLSFIDLQTNSQMTINEVRKFIEDYMLRYAHTKTSNILSNDLIIYAQDKPCFIAFLLNGKYIKRKKEEIFYKIGGKFKNKFHTVMLCQLKTKEQTISGHVAAVVVESERYYLTDVGVMYTGNSIEVSNTRKITEMELENILGINYTNFKKVE